MGILEPIAKYVAKKSNGRIPYSATKVQYWDRVVVTPFVLVMIPVLIALFLYSPSFKSESQEPIQYGMPIEDIQAIEIPTYKPR